MDGSARYDVPRAMNRVRRHIGLRLPLHTLNKLEQTCRTEEVAEKWLTYRTLKLKSELSSRHLQSVIVSLPSSHAFDDLFKISDRVVCLHR